MDWNTGDFCVAMSQMGSCYNARILELFPSRMEARVKNIRNGDIGDVSIDHLWSFQACAVNKAGILVEFIKSEDFQWPEGLFNIRKKEGDVCIVRREEDMGWYKVKILKIFNGNEVLVNIIDSDNAYFTNLKAILAADFTLICGEKEWKVSSAMISRRSPFFGAAISNSMAEKIEMKLEVKDLDPEAMEEVLNYMHGFPLKAEEHLFSSLLEASERFEMKDLKENVVEIGRKYITKENVVEIGKLADLYNVESLLEKCIEFIVENGIKIEEDNLAPKLTVGVLRLLEDELKWMRISRRRVIEARNEIMFDWDEREFEHRLQKDELKDKLSYWNVDLVESRREVKRLKSEVKQLKWERVQLDKENDQLEYHLHNVEAKRDKLKRELLLFKRGTCEVESGNYSNDYKIESPKARRRSHYSTDSELGENPRVVATSSREEAETDSDISNIEPPKSKRRKTVHRHKYDSSSESDYSTDSELGHSRDERASLCDEFSNGTSGDLCFSPEDRSEDWSDDPVFSEDDEDKDWSDGPVFSEDEEDQDWADGPVFSKDEEDKDWSDDPVISANEVVARMDEADQGDQEDNEDHKNVIDQGDNEEHKNVMDYENPDWIQFSP